MQPVALSRLPCLDPRTEVRQSALVDLGPAFSFSNPLGASPARGAFLLTRSQLDTLDLNALHTATWNDVLYGTVTAYKLVVTREPVKVHYTRRRSDGSAAYMVEVSDRRHLCHNDNFCIPVSKQYNVRAPGYQGEYYADTENSSTPWTWAELIEDLWELLSDQLGTFPGLSWTPDGTPEGFRFIGVSAWLSLCQVLNRIGGAVVWDPTKDPDRGQSQYSIVQVGAEDSTTADLLSQSERRGRLLHDAEFQPIVRGELPYGVRVHFHRLAQDAGTEDTSPAAAGQFITAGPYTVDIVGPETELTELIYHPLWDDLPAIYDASGSLTNTSALADRAQERADDYFRRLRTGGSRLFQRYDGLLSITPGSIIKEVRWGFHGIEGGLITEIVRHSRSDVLSGQGRDSSPLQPPDYGPTTPDYPPREQIVQIASATPSSGVYDATVKRVTTAPNTWGGSESVYAVDLAGSSSLTVGDRHKGRLVSWFNDRPLYAIRSGGVGGTGGGDLFEFTVTYQDIIDAAGTADATYISSDTGGFLRLMNRAPYAIVQRVVASLEATWVAPNGPLSATMQPAVYNPTGPILQTYFTLNGLITPADGSFGTAVPIDNTNRKLASRVSTDQLGLLFDFGGSDPVSDLTAGEIRIWFIVASID